MTTTKISTTKTPKTIILRGRNQIEGYMERLFTYNEKETAILIAQEWDRKGWKPFLQVQNYDRCTTILYNWKVKAKKKAA